MLFVRLKKYVSAVWLRPSIKAFQRCSNGEEKSVRKGER